MDKQRKIWTVSFSSTKGRVKKLHHTKSWLFYVLDLDDCNEDCTIDYETLVSQHKDSLYYSESEEEIVDEGTA